MSTTPDRAVLRDRICLMKFNDITALAKRLQGGSLGFDPNRKFARPMKESFADWILATFPHDDVYAALNAVPTEPDPFEDVPTLDPTNNPRPGKAPATASEGDQAAMVAQAIGKALGGLKFGLTDDEVKSLARDVATEVATPLALAAAAKAIAEATIPRPIEVKVTGAREVTTPLGVQHHTFESLLRLCNIRGHDGYVLNTWLVGPAGSGKTTAAANVAKALGLPFYFNGAIDTEYKLLGFTDAQGRVVSRPFRKAYEEGGVYLFDECDASLAGALLSFNAATSNGTCDFPDGNIKRHPDCIIIAAANTYGTGATNDYVGRNKLDGAFLDRFVQLAWDYDESLERSLSGNDAWVRKVQKVRKAINDLGIRHIVSPRASSFGAAMLAAGELESDVIERVVRKGLTDDQWRQVRSKAGL